jgi:hypothetical protein
MTGRICTVVMAIALTGAACEKKPDLDEVPLGTDVVLTREDGGVVEGTLSARDGFEVKVDVGPAVRAIRRDQIADVQLVDHSTPGTPVELPAIAKFREYSVPGGTRLTLELETPVNSETSKAGDTVQARLAEAVTIDDVVVVPAGAGVRGTVTAAEPAGKVNGRAHLAMQFTEMTVAGDTYAVVAPFAATAPSTRKDDAKKIGLPAAGGAIVGAIIGGGKGAAIGAAVGGGAGTAHVLLTEGKDIVLGPGATLAVSLEQPIDVKVPIPAKRVIGNQ